MMIMPMPNERKGIPVWFMGIPMMNHAVGSGPQADPTRLFCNAISVAIAVRRRGFVKISPFIHQKGSNFRAKATHVWLFDGTFDGCTLGLESCHLQNVNYPR